MRSSRRLLASGRAVASVLTVLLLAAGTVAAAPIRIEGNFDFSGQWRRDADANTVQLGGPQPIGNMTAPYGMFELFSPRAEFRAFTNPLPPIEIYAKIFQANDFFMGEGHTKLRFTWDGGEKERGLESYFFYRESRLSLGDPILSVAYGQFGQGIATDWWLGRGTLTFPGARWSGKLNVTNFNDGFGGEQNAGGEDNEAYSTKLRHDVRVNADINFYNEFLFAQKVWSNPGQRIQHNSILGTSLGVNWNRTSFAAQFNTSDAATTGLGAPDNDAIGFDLRNLVLLDRDWTGRLGANINFVKWGRNYSNTLGRTPETLWNVWYEPAPIGTIIQNGSRTFVQDQVRKDLYSEMYWDVPRYDASLVWRHQDKYGTTLFRDRIIARRNQIEANLKLIYNLELKMQATRVLWGGEQVLADFDQGRFIRYTSLTTNDYYAHLRLNRLRGSLKIDGRSYNHRSNQLWVSGIEGSYRLTDRVTLLGRFAKVWIERPDLWYAEWGGTSIVEPFFSRNALFAQLQYKPSDNSQFYLEYGSGYLTDNGLSLDGNLLYPGARTEPRIYTKLEMWF